MNHQFDFSNNICPICLGKEAEPTELGERDYKAFWVFQIACKGCGKFEIDNGRFAHRIELKDSERIVLSGIIRKHNDELGTIYPLAAINEYKVNILSAYVPEDVIDRIDLLLIYAAKKAPHMGVYTQNENEAAWRARIFLPKNSSFQTLLKAIESEGLIYVRTPQYGEICLTLKGWERVRELKSKKAIDSDQAFVAMWFNEGMDDVYTNAIYPAIKSFGLNPYRVDKNPGENRIDHEIMAQIRKSRFMVADVTGERSGVYYEAGFAQGIGIPVIWSCNSSWKTKLVEQPWPNSLEEPRLSEVTWPKRMHFDTRQFPHILWKDNEDLAKQLKSNIEGRGLNIK